ncbi:MAG: 4Fe-4S binding protein [Candidatus Hodarchaeota archaeon]
MVSTSKHPNITLFTYSEISKFSGICGNYNVEIHKKPRYINGNKCTGCGLCTTKCPIRVPNDFNRGIGERNAIYIPFPQAVPKIALIDKSVCIECKNCQRICSAEAIDFEQNSEFINLKVGAIIIATGWDEYPILESSEYKYGIYPDVITQIELERMLSPVGPTGGHVYRISDGKIPKTVAMIQCVGSRSLKGNQYCSGVCCNVALKNAQLLKQEYPDMEIVIFYIDMRTWDKRNEEYYRKAREAGIIMIRGKVGDIRMDQTLDKMKVTASSTLTNDFITINPDLVVLSTGMVPSKETVKIAEILGLARDENGFLTEVHGCLKPQETNNLGIYICGCAAGPKNIPYSVSTALAAASKASTLLSKDTINQELIIAEIDENLCVGCHRCEKLCNYKAIKVNGKDVAEIDELKCKGCGVCITSCPNRAIDLKYYRDKQIIEEVKGICSPIIEYKEEYIESIELIWKKIEALTPYQT